MISQISEKKLLNIINEYIKKSEFYQTKYNNINVKKYTNIPFLTKNELIKDQEMHSPFGSNMIVKPDKIQRVHKTSGTTTKPYLIAVTKSDIKTITKIGSQLFQLTGMNKNDMVVNCLNYNMWMGGYTDHQSLENTGACVIPFGVGHTEELILLLQKIKWASLHCTPSYLGILYDKLLQMNLTPKDLRLKNGYFAAEGGLENKKFRDKIEKTWKIDAYNANYGLSEVISIIGSECRYKKGLHFGALKYLYTELIDANLQSIPIKKGAIGELVVTHLKKESQPLIRYRTGDLFEILSTKKCTCGFEGFRFKLIGRVDNMVVIKGVNFFPESLRTIISAQNSCTGMYKVIISKEKPIQKVTILIETVTKIKSMTKVKKDIIHEIKNKLNISVNIQFTDKIIFSGNKIKILERI